MKILSFRKYTLVLSKIKKHITFLPTYFILFKKISLRPFFHSTESTIDDVNLNRILNHGY